MALVKGACAFFEFEFKISYRIRVYGVYLEIGQQSMLQQKPFWKDLEKIYKKRLYENGRIQKFIADNSRLKKVFIFNLELSAINFRILPFSYRDVFCRSFRDLSKKVFVVALIVDRFRDKRHKHEYGKIS